MSDEAAVIMLPSTALAEAATAADEAAARGTFARYRTSKAEQTLRAHDGDLTRWVRYLQAVGVDGVTCAWGDDPSC